jgi:hypothetical protein
MASSLENPLLYRNFLKVLERNNPDIEVDPDDIDRMLEYDEAFNELKEIYPGLRMTGKDKSELQQFRDYLNEEFGMDERKVQNLIIQDPKQPISEDELAGVGYALHGRSDNAILTDRAKKAPVTRDVRNWASKPNRLDLGGIDRPGAKDHHLAARINMLEEINECSRKRSCGTVENLKNRLELAGKYDKRDIEKALAAAKDAGYV